METNFEKEVSQKMQEEVEKFTAIKMHIMQTLEGNSITLDGIAEALKPYFPSRSIEDLINDCYLILEGIAEGEKVFDEFHEKAEKGTDAYVEVLKMALQNKTAEESRTQLLLLYKRFCEINSHELTLEDSAYLNVLSEEELLFKNATMLSMQAEHEANLLLEFLECNKNLVKEDTTFQENLYTENEDRFISAVAFYALENEKEEIAPIVAGKQVGFFGKIRNFLSGDGGEKITIALCIVLLCIGMTSSCMLIGPLLDILYFPLEQVVKTMILASGAKLFPLAFLGGGLLEIGGLLLTLYLSCLGGIAVGGLLYLLCKPLFNLFETKDEGNPKIRAYLEENHENAITYLTEDSVVASDESEFEEASSEILDEESEFLFI